jgi:hypothetical protein
MEESDGTYTKNRKRKTSLKLSEYLFKDEEVQTALKTANYVKMSNERKKKKWKNNKTDILPILHSQSISRKKMKLPVQKPLTAKQIEENDREEWLLNDFNMRLRRFIQNSVHPLRQGPWNVSDITDAIKCGVKESNTLLLDWTNPEVQKIGRLCKIYWDGEDKWFYARIINYDDAFKLHLVSHHYYYYYYYVNKIYTLPYRFIT